MVPAAELRHIGRLDSLPNLIEGWSRSNPASRDRARSISIAEPGIWRTTMRWRVRCPAARHAAAMARRCRSRPPPTNRG